MIRLIIKKLNIHCLITQQKRIAETILSIYHIPPVFNDSFFANHNYHIPLEKSEGTQSDALAML